MILVGRAYLFATPIATGTQQGAAGERGIAGPEEEILLVMAPMSDQIRSKPSTLALDGKAEISILNAIAWHLGTSSFRQEFTRTCWPCRFQGRPVPGSAPLFTCLYRAAASRSECLVDKMRLAMVN
jgi:hypothetical protein